VRKGTGSLALFAVALALGAGVGDAAADGEREALRRLRSPVSPSVPADLPEPAARTAGADRAPAAFPEEFRRIDGRGNNGARRRQGAAGSRLLRLTTVAYEDGSDAPAGAERPNPRALSNQCATQKSATLAPKRVSDMFWQWGQFLDHDLSLTPVAEPAEPFDVPIPAGDAWFDPDATGAEAIPLDRSSYRRVGGVRHQLNGITAYIDASNVYGSDRRRARALRARDGSGRLATSAGDLLPFNSAGLPNAPGPGDHYFLGGDFRANEQAGLTAMHTLFVREHNFWAGELRATRPELSGGEIYRWARAIVGAEMQAITYREFLPLLLGRSALPPWTGYDPAADAGIANVFATAAYRFGHSMLSPTLLRLDADGAPIAAGHLPLAGAFFNPRAILDHGIEPLLRGLAAQRAQAIDNQVVDGVRNFLFGPPGAGGFDLASLNIQRGRDHGLPSYNQVRIDFGLAPAATFADVNPDPAVQADLAAAYGSVDLIDPWVGGLAEPRFRGALVGETYRAILADQFRRLRDGDRFWYQGYLPPDLVELVEQQTLAKIIRRNTGIGRELQKKVLRVRR